MAQQIWLEQLLLENFIQQVKCDYIRLHYTAVLKSVIHFSNAKFPPNTPTNVIDGYARYFICGLKLNYDFGTGHGVGSFGNVHEYPSISPKSRDTYLQPNQIITVEPVIYNDEYGIRIENMLVSRNDGDFIVFETLNFVPFEKDLIDYNLLTHNEIDWINAYNNTIIDIHNNVDNDTMEFLRQYINVNWR